MACIFAVDDIVRVKEDLESKDGKKKLPKDMEGKVVALLPKDIIEVDFGAKLTPKIWTIPEEYLAYVKHEYEYTDKDGDDYYNEWGGVNYSRGGYYKVKTTRVKKWNGSAYETKVL